MLRPLLIKAVAPAVVAAGLLSFVLVGGSPPSVQADISIPMTQGTPSLAPMLKNIMPAVVNLSLIHI